MSFTAAPTPSQELTKEEKLAALDVQIGEA